MGGECAAYGPLGCLNEETVLACGGLLSAGNSTEVEDHKRKERQQVHAATEADQELPLERLHVILVGSKVVKV
jgi:hypothetical protein